MTQWQQFKDDTITTIVFLTLVGFVAFAVRQGKREEDARCARILTAACDTTTITELTGCAP